MWDKSNARDITKKCIKKYGKELFNRESQVAESIDVQIDELVAAVIKVDKDLISTARQWRIAFKSIAIAEGLNESRKLVIQDEKEETEDLEKKEAVQVEEVKEVATEELDTKNIKVETQEDFKVINTEVAEEELEELFEYEEKNEEHIENMEDI
jgi:hypothetical protein